MIGGTPTTSACRLADTLRRHTKRHQARVSATLLVCGVAAGLAVSLSASSGQDQPAPLFRTRADVVRVDVLANAAGRPLADLKSEDFELYDNGVLQRANLASIDDLEIDVVLALDASTSVKGGLLTSLRQAAAALVGALKPGDRAAMLTFANAIAVRAPLTDDRTALGRALEQVDAAGSTSLIDAAFASLAMMHGNERPTLLLIFSDGVDTASWLTAPKVVDFAKRSSLVADAVVVGNRRLGGGRRHQGAGTTEPGGPHEDVIRFLADITSVTGGRVIEGEGGSRLSGAFVEALKTFRTRYQLTYTPNGVDQPGYHSVAVRVKRPGATVRARPGYTR